MKFFLHNLNENVTALTTLDHVCIITRIKEYRRDLVCIKDFNEMIFDSHMDCIHDNVDFVPVIKVRVDLKYYYVHDINRFGNNLNIWFIK
jgi:hypothetical protein